VSGAEPDSPCTAVCVLDSDSGYCRGCFRSIAEITAWGSLGPAEKRQILGELPARRGRGTHPPASSGPAG
jgi:predicted Fe-S protein YdhL (DUF1289 family)